MAEGVAREENEDMCNDRKTTDLKYHLKDGENQGPCSGVPLSSTTEASSSAPKANKGKSCKGTLYYSSTIKSKSRNPLCVGFTRSLSHVPLYIVGESEMQASKEIRIPTDFKYACVGYSVYKDCKIQSGEAQDTQTELPVCVGLEVLVDKRAKNSESSPAHIHNREDGHGVQQRRLQKPAHSLGDEFLSRFTRNANLVAMGVVKNLRRVGNHIKDSVDDILYPYRRRPK